MLNAFITGVAGERIGADERRFLRDARPAGLILFARNCRDGGQIRALIADFKSAVGEDGLLVLIDQEGGRVQRLKPPLVHALPAAAAFASLHAEAPDAACRAAFLVSQLLAGELAALGINTNCAPVLDVKCPGAHAVIGDRAYGSEPGPVVALGRAVAEGLLAGGVLPVIKHIPGHGRANADSHLDLPVVTAGLAELAASDFATFRALADLPAAMTAHVVFTAIDAHAPASTSATMTRQIIRGTIGFDGLLMSDDLSMGALEGPIGQRAAAALAAGCDLALHCNGRLEEMREVAAGVPALSGRALQRFERARAAGRRTQAFDVAEAQAALVAVLAKVA